MNIENDIKKEKCLKNKIYTPKLNTLYINSNYSECKKDEINQENFSQSIINSKRYLTTFDESSFDSRKLHVIKKPYKIFLPIRTKMKKIKNTRELSLNNYYRKTLRNEFILKDLVITDSFNTKINNSKDQFKKTPKMSRVLKSTIELSNSNKNNLSKKGFLSTERTSTIKDGNNINLSISKYNHNYDKYKIFSYKNKKNISNQINITESNINDTNNDYKILRFLNINQGYKNLHTLKHCVNNFTNEIKSLTREKYMNYCLKEHEATIKAKHECNNDNFKIEMKTKLDNKNLFDIFYNDYNTYSNKLQVKKIKDTDYTSLLKWEIISYKNEVNRLNIKKEKLLARLNKYIKMKYFLITMKNYSLDKKDDSWMFHHSSKKNNDYSNLIKENRRIVDPNQKEMNNSKRYLRRSSVDNQSINKFNKMLVNEEKYNHDKRRLKRLNSSGEKNVLGASAIKDIATILNNHIANLLIYKNQLRIDLEPLKEEFNNLYNSLKISDEKKNQLLKLEFIILPEKKRIVKERNDFLTKSFFNLNNIIFNASKYIKMNKLIQEKLSNIYKTLLDNNIISYTYLKASSNDNIIEQILFFLKNIENGLNILFEDKKIIKKKYPEIYHDVIKEMYLDIKIRTLEAQKKLESKLSNKKKDKIADRMKKSIIINRRKDYYKFGYIRKKEKIVYKKVDPYEELIFSDDNNSDKN